MFKEKKVKYTGLDSSEEQGEVSAPSRFVGEPRLSIVSLGAGVQSSVMILLAAHGKLKDEKGRKVPAPKYAIFADTGWEPEGVYKHLRWLERELEGKHPKTKHLIKNKIKIIRASRLDCRNPHKRGRPPSHEIQKHLLKGENSTGQKFLSVPVFMFNKEGKKSIARRQCTREYKLEPIRRKMRELCGLKFRQVMPRKDWVEQWIGISTDEIFRMKEARDPWLKSRWPLIEMDMSRSDCKAWFKRHYPHKHLPRSACIGCPMHSDKDWIDMKKHDKRSWKDAVRVDRLLRRGSRGEKLGGEVYLHRAMVPLDKVDFKASREERQLSLKDECEGMCGV